MIQFNKRLFLVRHGETEFNIKGVMQGHVDSPLTDLGIKQAKDTAELVKEMNIDVLASSDLKRAIDTAEIISVAINIPVSEKISTFRERFFGEIEGVGSCGINQSPVKRFRGTSKWSPEHQRLT